MWRWLSAHPDLFLPARRELGYYAVPDLGTFLEKPEDPRLLNVVEDPNRYAKAFTPSGERLSGDGSSVYSLVPGAARRMFKDKPDAKLIFMLEAPVRRALTAHAYNLTLEVETEPHFEKALLLESERKEQGVSPFLLYARGSRYRQMIEPVDDLFGRDNVLILIAEEAERAPQATVDRLCAFLGIRNDAGSLPSLPRPRQSVVSEMLARVRSRRRQPEICAQFRSEMQSEVHWVEQRVGSALDAWMFKDQE